MPTNPSKNLPQELPRHRPYLLHRNHRFDSHIRLLTALNDIGRSNHLFIFLFFSLLTYSTNKPTTLGQRNRRQPPEVNALNRRRSARTTSTLSTAVTASTFAPASTRAYRKLILAQRLFHQSPITSHFSRLAL